MSSDLCRLTSVSLNSDAPPPLRWAQAQTAATVGGGIQADRGDPLLDHQ
jgi:hypothetical protein